MPDRDDYMVWDEDDVKISPPVKGQPEQQEPKRDDERKGSERNNDPKPGR